MTTKTSPQLADALAQLEAARSEQVATILARRNPQVRVLGVRFGDLDKIAKKLKRQTALAHELWDTGSFEARTLAVRSIDPADVTPELAERWAREIDYPTLADEWAGVVYQTPFAEELMERWTASGEEFVRRAGFGLVFRFAADLESGLSDERFLAYLDQIEREIHQSPNWSREMMNMVPVAIGLRTPELHAPALAASRAYSPVSVFHGDKTNCKIRNAVDDLLDPRVKMPKVKSRA
jgi:3-methyladenine DNA glycosylase AlkD